MKKYRFFFHYNKANNKITVHFKKQCYIVDDIGCFVDIYSKWNKQQPKLVIQGWAEKVVIAQNKTAIIT